MKEHLYYASGNQTGSLGPCHAYNNQHHLREIKKEKKLSYDHKKEGRPSSKPGICARKELDIVSHEAVCSAVSSSVLTHFGDQFASQGSEHNIMLDIFLTALQGKISH